jgi:hypothetical protein
MGHAQVAAVTGLREEEGEGEEHGLQKPHQLLRLSQDDRNTPLKEQTGRKKLQDLKLLKQLERHLLRP